VVELEPKRPTMHCTHNASSLYVSIHSYIRSLGFHS